MVAVASAAAVLAVAASAAAVLAVAASAAALLAVAVFAVMVRLAMKCHLAALAIILAHSVLEMD